VRRWHDEKRPVLAALHDKWTVRTRSVPETLTAGAREVAGRDPPSGAEARYESVGMRRAMLPKRCDDSCGRPCAMNDLPSAWPR